MDTKEFTIEWCKDLRSGQYKQGIGCLRTRDGKYCCLGVARETAKRLGINTNEADSDWWPGSWFHDIFGTCNPLITIKDRSIECTCANDDYEYSFSVIADALENKYVKNQVE